MAWICPSTTCTFPLAAINKSLIVFRWRRAAETHSLGAATGRDLVSLWIMLIRLALAPAKNSSPMSNGNGFVSSYGEPVMIEVTALLVFGDRAVGHAANGGVKDGLFAACEILLDSSVRDLSHKRFLEPFGKDGKHALQVVLMNAF